MSTRNFRIGRKVRVFSRAASISVLSLAIILMPLPGNISVAYAGPGQNFSTGSGADVSNQGADSATQSGLQSTTDGATNTAAGSKQMKCCKEGCDGAGKKAAGDSAKEAADAASKASGIKAPEAPSTPSTPPPSTPSSPPPPMPIGVWNFHTLPKAEAILCSASGSKAKMVYDLFHPQKVEAMAGCNDAMMSMAQGAMQMLQGLAGLAAAAMAAANQSKGQQNTAAFGPTESGIPAADGPKVVGPTDLSGGNSTSGIKIDPSILRTGKVGAAMDKFENTFGIPRDTWANSLANGVDPRQMLMNAPKNPISAEDLNMAFAAAKNMSPEQKAAALADQNAFARELAAKVGTTGEISASGGVKNSSKSSKELDELDLMGADAAKTADAANAANSQLSPELQAALAEKDAASVREGTNIFQIVHEKYQQRVRMIYGFDAHGKSIGGKGVADANGF